MRYLPSGILAAAGLVGVLVVVFWGCGYNVVAGHNPYTTSAVYGALNRIAALSAVSLITGVFSGLAITVWSER